MSTVLEEKLREAASLGDIETVQTLISYNVNINSQNAINGWTALHWACKRGYTEIVRVLLNSGADPNILNENSEKPANVCENLEILKLLGESNSVSANNGQGDDLGIKIIPNYIRNPPLNGQIDMSKLRARHADFSFMPNTALPSQAEDLVLKVRVAGSHDPDFIEIEIPRFKLSYSGLLAICSEELGVAMSQIERIRKLPNTRLRKDSDVRRLTNLQSLEIVLKSKVGCEKSINTYESISAKDQTILY